MIDLENIIKSYRIASPHEGDSKISLNLEKSIINYLTIIVVNIFFNLNFAEKQKFRSINSQRLIIESIYLKQIKLNIKHNK